MIDPAALQMALCVLTGWIDRREREAQIPGRVAEHYAPPEGQALDPGVKPFAKEC